MQPWILWVWLILVLLVNHLPMGTEKTIDIPGIDKLVHFVEYGVAGALSLWCYNLRVIFAFLGLSLLAAADEFTQGFVPSRNPDVLDWLCDCGGGLTGIMGAFLWTRR